MAKRGPKSPVEVAPIDFSHLGPRGHKRLVAFAEQYLFVPKGKNARKPFKLEKWQRDILAKFFPMRGRRPLQGVVSMPRGQGKSTLAAVMGLYCLLADEEEAAQVLVVASDERQAGHVFGSARRMVELSPALADQVQIYTDRIVVPRTGSELRPLPAEPSSLQGFAPSVTIVDELHVVRRETWDAMALAAGKRESSLTMAISTPADSTESVMWDLVSYGREHPEDKSFVLVEYAAPDGCAVGDEEAWRQANPALGTFLAVDAIRATLKTTRESVFRRYRLGQWVGQVDRWLPWGAWEAVADPDRRVKFRERVWLAFDGSASGDSTALVGCTGDGHLFVVGLWHNPGDERWRVPREEVTAAIDEAFIKWDVVELACDPWGWRSEIEAWAKRHGRRRVVEFNTGAAQRMAPATDRLYQAVVTRGCSHDGNPVMAAHFGNAVAKATPLGDLVSKDKRGSPRKIDAAVAGIVAFERAAWHQAKRGQRTPGRRVVVL